MSGHERQVRDVLKKRTPPVLEALVQELRVDQRLGKFEDMACEGGQIVGAILSVSGTSSTGRRYIAADPSSISIKYSIGDDRWTASSNAEVRSRVPLPGKVEALKPSLVDLG